MTDVKPVSAIVYALRAVFMLLVIAGLLMLAQSRGSFVREESSTVPPLAKRFELRSGIERDRAEAERNKMEKQELLLYTEALKLAADNPLGNPLQLPRMVAILGQLSEGNSKKLADEISALVKKAEDAKAAREKELAEAKKAEEKKRLEEERKKREAEQASSSGGSASTGTSGTSGTASTGTSGSKPDYKNEEITGPVKGAYIVIYPKRKLMGICVDKEWIRTYRNIAVPTDLASARDSSDSKAPPVGNYYVCARTVAGNGRVMQISYPAPHDAKKALAAGRIDGATEAAIGDAYKKRAVPPQDTPLGESVFITSDRETVEQTSGGFAILPAQFDEIWTATKLGAWVMIVN